jgi:hypothetical protein
MGSLWHTAESTDGTGVDRHKFRNILLAWSVGIRLVQIV